MRILFMLFFLSATLFSQTELYPKQRCEAYNNLKHTTNRGNVTLDMEHTYTMLKHHKGQYLVKVPDATPAQRWVDDDCLSLRPLRGTPLYEKRTTSVKQTVQPTDTAVSLKEKKEHPSTQKPLLLALSWHNAFCETHRYKKECKQGWKRLLGKAKSDNNFVLHGLWPQPRDRVYCGVDRRYITADKYKHWNKLPEPKLTAQTKAKLKEVMPGVDSNLHRHEWIKHGTCYGTDAETYFKDAIALTQEVRQSEVARFFQKNVGKRITVSRLKEVVDRSFGAGAGSHVELRCNRGLITELWLHLNGRGAPLATLLKKGKKVHSRCQRGIIDRAGYR